MPSEAEKRAFLVREQANYYIDSRRYANELHEITFLAGVGPTASGKSTLIRETLNLDPEIHQYLSSTTRPRTPRDGDDYETGDEGVTLDDFYEAVKEHSMLNYFVHPNGHLYGTFLKGIKPPFTIGAIGAKTVPQLMAAGFHDFHSIYTLMDGDTYADRLGLEKGNNGIHTIRPKSRLESPDIRPRLQEGLASLAFARVNLDFQWMTPMQLTNDPGSLQESARQIVNLAYERSIPTITKRHSLMLIDEMTDVIRTASDTLEV